MFDMCVQCVRIMCVHMYTYICVLYVYVHMCMYVCMWVDVCTYVYVCGV